MALDEETIKAKTKEVAKELRNIAKSILDEGDKAFVNSLTKEIAELAVYLSLGTKKEQKYALEAISDLQLAITSRMAQAQLRASSAAQKAFALVMRSAIRLLVLGK